jgi:hypothetical protein
MAITARVRVNVQRNPKGQWQPDCTVEVTNPEIGGNVQGELDRLIDDATIKVKALMDKVIADYPHDPAKV